MRVRSIRLVAFAASAALLGVMPAVVTPPAAQARIDQTPSIGWQPNGRVTSITSIGNMIVLGGTFTAVSRGGTSVPRARLAALNATTGALLPWNPGANGDVNVVAAAPDGSGVFVGGNFTSVAGAARTRVAKISTSGAALPFVASANGRVLNLLPVGTGVYVVGNFTQLRGANRGRGGFVNGTTGQLGAWNPRVEGAVDAIARAADGSLYLGGDFSRVAGSDRNHMAKVSGSSGALSSWRPAMACRDVGNPCRVFDLAISGANLYAAVGGPGGQVTALDLGTGGLKWWTAGDGDVQTVVVDGNRIYAGGHFVNNFGGLPRGGLVALNATTGAVLPDITVRLTGSSVVWSLVRRDSRLLIGGAFTRVGTQRINAYTTMRILPDPPDRQAPGAPTGLAAPAALPRAVTLTWNRATDNLGVTAYRVYRDGQGIGTSGRLTFTDRGVAGSSRHSYTVRAVDAAGNASAASRAVTVTVEPARTTLLQLRSRWTYKSDSQAARSGWTGASFDTAGWSFGVGPFGFGDGDEATVLSPFRGVTSYFRNRFTVTDARLVRAATLRLQVDDGAVAYLNGREIARVGLPSGAVGSRTNASVNVEGAAEHAYRSLNVPLSSLRTGSNVLAVEVHNASISSPDLSFDAFVTAALAPAPPTPAGLKGSVKRRMARLSWSPTPVTTFYTVFRNGRKIATTTTPKYFDYGVVRPKRYRYTVSATGSVESGQSAPVSLRGILKPLKGRVAVRTLNARGRLLADVKPNLKRYNYRLKIQVKKGKSWRVWRRVTTTGRKDLSIVNPPKGRYRVRMPAQLGATKAVSRVLRLTR